MAPTSPLKRVTRARAAKSSINDISEPSKKALAAKLAGVRKTKAAARSEEPPATTDEKPAKKTTTKPAPSASAITTAPRRRVKVTPLVTAPVEELESASTEPAAPEKASRTKKTAPITESKTAAPKIEKTTKSRAKKVPDPPQEDEVKAAPKTRGRPKKAVVQPAEPVVELEKHTRQTRKRADSNLDSENPTEPTTRSTAVQKKKVTFQDLPDDDKENRPVPTKRGTGKKESTATTGIRARPVRKPVAAATRKKTAASKNETQAPRALTPKKITQVARSSTPIDSDEDELNGGKTPVRDLSQSPKRGVLAVRSPSPVKKLDFTQTLSATSTLKTSIHSPPRRLPQSPFKNSLRDSPKRGEGIPVFPTLTATLGVAAAGATNPQAEAALQQSPKRGMLDSSIFSQSTTKLQSHKKPFLSQSPMRKLFSPAKQCTRVGASTDNSTAEITETAVSSYLKRSQSPLRSARVHRMSDEELALDKAQGIDFDESVLNIRSPVKVPKPMPDFPEGKMYSVMHMDKAEDADLAPATPRGPWSKAEEAEFAPPEEEEEDYQVHRAEDLEMVDSASTAESSNDGPPLTANAASYLLNMHALREEDESSEDELQSDETPARPLFGGRPSLSTKTVRARLSSGLSKETGSNNGFTPLATQLSGWLAGSPEKEAKRVTEAHEVIFSPLAAQHVPGEVQISRQSTPVVQKSAGARQSFGLRKSTAARSSLVPSMTGSPAASSYFADEMAARDLEEQVEAQESINTDSMITPQDAETAAAHESMNIVPISLVTNDDTTRLEDDLDEALSTTGVVEEPVMTDTAMLDFVNIAQEAAELALSVEAPSQSSTSSEYGDENTVIITRPEVPVVDETTVAAATSSPVAIEDRADIQLDFEVMSSSNEEAIFFNTPIRPDLSQLRFANTVVSKVPLRPEGHISPLKVSRKRSRSLSAGPGSGKKPLLESGAFSIPKSNTVISFSPERNIRSPARTVAASTPGQRSFAVDDFGDSTLDGIEIPDESDEEVEAITISKAPTSIKSSKIRSTVATPARSPLKAVGTGVLHGAVVYVDVHTTEGADASGIFVDLLTQMGAKCVREWKWNPRAGLAADDVENMATPTRVGVTHVVYKDGGKRTLEKVRDAKGEVCCVGVGWVLDCERENRWLDESTYMVDPSILPRGGSRRRKSMEPRALINANGSLSTARGRSISAEMTKEMREELVNTPVRQPLMAMAQPNEPVENEAGDEDDAFSPDASAATPTGFVKYDPSTSLSPKTPYLMKEGAKLIQQSAPPKQIQQGLFPVSGKIEDRPDENTRAKLDAARRRTMNWRPRVASPLGK